MNVDREKQRDSLLRAIESELNDVRGRASRSGWTPWVLLTAVVGLLGSSYTSLTSTSVSIPIVSVEVLWLSATLVIYFLVKVLGPVAFHRDRPYVMPQDIVGLRRMFSSTAALSCILVGLSIQVAETQDVWSLHSTAGALAILLFSSLTVWATLQPNPIRRSRLRLKSGAGVVATLGIGSSLLFMSEFGGRFLEDVAVHPVETKTAITLVGAIIAFVSLASLPVLTELESKLANLHRRLLLSELDQDEAGVVFRVITQGGSVGDVLYHRVIAVMRTYASLQQLFQHSAGLLRPFADDCESPIEDPRRRIQLYLTLKDHYQTLDIASGLYRQLRSANQALLASLQPSNIYITHEDEGVLGFTFGYMAQSATGCLQAEQLYVDKIKRISALIAEDIKLRDAGLKPSFADELTPDESALMENLEAEYHRAHEELISARRMALQPLPDIVKRRGRLRALKRLRMLRRLRHPFRLLNPPGVRTPALSTTSTRQD